MAIGADHQSTRWTRWKSLSGGCTSWEECLQKTSSEDLSSRLGHELKILLRDDESVFKNFIQLNFNMQVFCICHFCIVDIVKSRKGEYLEGLGTSFITDMHSVGQV